MKVLFAHQNFPGQYLHLAKYLASDHRNEVVFLTQRKDVDLPGVRRITYAPKRTPSAQVHHYLREMEGSVLNGQETARVAMELKSSGFVPDIMLGHNGWGEIWYLKDVFPSSPLLGYFEFFYRQRGADVGFDPHDPPTVDTDLRLRTKNIGNLLGLDACDWGHCPTEWQRSLFPRRYQTTLSVVHEGIDTNAIRPDTSARFQLPGHGVELTAGDEVLTFVARNLEPYRGFEVFMRSLPDILRSRPAVRVLIVGADGVSYGARLPNGETYKDRLLKELEGELDLSRLHFLGRLPYSHYLKVLQISRVHVYMTFPFVLSWSMLEAMSAGCVVVGSRTPPVEEVILDGHNGFLVDFFNTSDLTRRVVECLANPNELLQVRLRARETIWQKYDLSRVCLPGFLNLIERVKGSI